jgi:hypothetical protein
MELKQEDLEKLVAALRNPIYRTGDAMRDVCR